MNYGVPYKGSKNKIAKEIADQLPAATYFFDLFAGGCAVTHAAMLSGKWTEYHVNDIDDAVTLFRNAVNGDFRNETRWISRKQFERLKDTDPYIRICWSFGNNGRDYLYSPEIERFKKHLHYVFFAETPEEALKHWHGFVKEFEKVKKEIDTLSEQAEKLCDDCGVELTRNTDGTIDAKTIKTDVLRVLSADIREYMRGALTESGHTAADVDRLLGTNGMAGHYFGASQWALPTRTAYEKMQTIIPGLTVPWAELNESLQSLERLQSLQSLESLESLQSLQSLERLKSLERCINPLRLMTTVADYQSLIIPPDSVIYCDIPYKGTDGYSADNKNDFDYERFYQWACEQTQPIFISEYSMPEDRFECVWERRKTSSYGTGNNKKTIERLFVPKH